MSFARNLALLRGFHNLSNAEASRLLGFSQQTLSEWQTGKQQPSYPAVKAIAGFFEVPIELLDGDSPQALGAFYFEPGHWARIEAKINPQAKVGRAADG